jgi:hypothetical protein
LINRCHTQRLSDAGRIVGDRLAVDFDIAAVPFDGAGDDLDQR